MQKEQATKIGLIGIGIAGILSSIVYDRFFKPVAPTGMEDITSILLQLGSLASFLMGMFADIKKAIPQEAIAQIREMMKDGKINISEVIALYPTLNFAAIMEIVKKYITGKDKTIKVDGDVIKVEPAKPDAGRVSPPNTPAATDDDVVRQILSAVTQFKKPVKLAMTVAGKPALTVETVAPSADPVSSAVVA